MAKNKRPDHGLSQTFFVVDKNCFFLSFCSQQISFQLYYYYYYIVATIINLINTLIIIDHGNDREV